MRHLVFTTLFAMLTLTVSAQNFNPIVPDNIADPSISKFGDTYYLYATSDINRGLSQAGTPVVWKSKDFVNWSFEGSLLSGIDWAKGYSYTDKNGKQRTGYFRYWAPGRVIKKEGKYLLYATIVSPDETCPTYVFVADKPEGPFRVTNGDGIFAKGMEGAKIQTTPILSDIDGEPFVDEDGQGYIFWRRRKAGRLSADFLSLEGAERTLSTKRTPYSEGPVMFKRKGIYYYIYTLSGSENYVNAYMMSKEGPLTGLEAPEGNDIFIFSSIPNNVWGPGHGNVFYDEKNDSYYFVYLEYGEGGTTRQVFANKMEFNSDGTIQTITPDRKGVGYLAKSRQKRTNLAPMAVVTVSSATENRDITRSIETQPNDPLPEKGSVQEVKRTHTYVGKNVVDNSNGSRWIAAPGDDKPWIMLDLQKKT
jgi:beta-xylosidase